MEESIFYITITKQNGKKCMILRNFIYDENQMKKIVNEIFKKGYCNINGKVIFRNPSTATLKLLDFLK